MEKQVQQEIIEYKDLVIRTAFDQKNLEYCSYVYEKDGKTLKDKFNSDSEKGAKERAKTYIDSL